MMALMVLGMPPVYSCHVPTGCGLPLGCGCVGTKGLSTGQARDGSRDLGNEGGT
jgi:hypothetical protein